MDVLQFHTKGEEEYFEQLMALDPSWVASWTGRVDIDVLFVPFCKKSN